MVIDGTDNIDYFIYKFNISLKDQKRLLFLNNFNSQKISRKKFSEKNLNKIFYFNGREALMDIIYFKIFNCDHIVYWKPFSIPLKIKKLLLSFIAL